MKMLVIILMYLLFVGSLSATFETLQKQYKAMRLQTISTLIPSISLQTNPPKKVLVNVQKFFNISEIEAEQQIKRYAQNYGTFTQGYAEWKKRNWKADPELSVVFDLTETKRNESFIIKGLETSILVIDINVNNLDALNTKHDGVTLFVTNLSGLNEDLQRLSKEDRANKFHETLAKNIEYKTRVRKSQFLSIPFSSDIYEIWIVRQPLDDEPFTGVHISLQLALEQQSYQNPNPQMHTLSPEKQEQMVKAIKQIVDQNNLTFLDSLELWEKVQQHRRQHEKSYEWNEAVELYECLGLVVMYVVEYAIIRFIARKKQVV